MTSPLETSIERAVAEWPVVGLGCGVVAAGEPLFARGFGVRRAGSNEAVTERTLFAIGSVSKSFTAALVAMLVDEGAIGWDSRVIDHLPKFRVFDPFVTREMTVRDLLTHRSGLERGDFMWYKSGYDADEVVRRVAYLKPTWSFRSTFGYQNVMYLAAGQLIETLTGKSWDDAIRERIFEPLAMHDSHPSAATLDKDGDVALPHLRLGDRFERIVSHEGFNMNPAGSIYSNARDMLAWLQLALGNGVVGGERLLSTGSSEATRTPQMPMALSAWSELFPGAEFLSYASGWFVWSYRGLTVVSHGGNIDGMSAVAAVVPEAGFGIAAFTNVNGSRIPQALVYHAIESTVFNRPGLWLNEFRENERIGRERLDYIEEDRKRSRVPNTLPSRPLSVYAGTYGDDFYGTATVALQGDRLQFDFIGFRGPLDHWHFDTFTLAIADPYLKTYSPVLRFDLDDFGQPSQLTLSLLGGVRMPLQRKPEEPLGIDLPIETLRSYEGRYVSQAAALTIAIDFVGTALRASVPGALAGSGENTIVRELVAVAEDRFAIRSTQSELRFGDAGAVTLETPHQLPITLTKSEPTARPVRG
ncbi:MAG TPA: serine hydrolase [Candidatus Acidoferrales bacterium]|nr:serine hydrolase [Candidatus Acidoferrales bacterium]